MRFLSIIAGVARKFSASISCDELSSGALEALGDAEKALSKARLLWNQLNYMIAKRHVYLYRAEGEGRLY